MAKGCNNYYSKNMGTSACLQRVSRPPCRMKGRTQSKRRRQRQSAKQKPLPAFFLFMEDHRPQLRCENPHWTVVQMAKKLGAAWHQQTKAEKERYLKKAARLRNAYSKLNRIGCSKKRKRKTKKKKKTNKSCCRKILDDLECLVCC